MQSARPISKSADEFVEKFSLQPHPFGCGYFIETDRDSKKINIEKPNGESVERNISTAIIALFKGDQINPLHRTASTQIIHYYPGGNSKLLVHVLEQNGKLTTCTMPDDAFQLKIPSMTWFAFEVETKNKDFFVLTGHTVSPGFDPSDLELANRQALTYQYPTLTTFISNFTLDNSKQNCPSATSKQSIEDESKEHRCVR